MKISPRIPLYARAMRLPFLTAGIFPFIAGSLLWRGPFNAAGFVLGLIAVAATHISANMFNDYSDSKYGADNHDRKFYGFFGGSKLIQDKVLPASFYLKAALVFAAVALLAAAAIAWITAGIMPLGYFLLIAFLGFSYSHAPLRLCYNRLGEAVIFILFGPACVMGAYFIQCRLFPDMGSFILSLPFGFFTASILAANEIPDLPDDLKARKYTLISLTGRRLGFLLYIALAWMGAIGLSLNIVFNGISWLILGGLFAVFFIVKAAAIMQKDYNDKDRMTVSSALAIKAANVVYLFIIAALIAQWWK